MNLQDVIDDPKAKELCDQVMVDVGLDREPSFYNSVFAHSKRCRSADILPEAILKHAQNGETISPPVNDIIKVVKATAKNLEKDRDTLALTYEVMRMAIYGHIWIGILIARGARRFNQIMAKDGVLSILNGLIGFGSAKGACGGGGGGGGDCDDCGGCGSGGGG